jgi:uncharacterized protein YuzE
MEERLAFSYDREGDILDISIGKPRAAISKEVDNDVFVRQDKKTGEVVGFMIMNFEKRFGKLGKEEVIPVSGKFKLEKSTT